GAMGPRRDLQDDPPRVGAGGGEVDNSTVALDIRDELVEVEIEVVDRVLLDPPGQVAEPVGVRELEDAELPRGMLVQDGLVHRPLELLVPRRLGAEAVKIERRRRRLGERSEEHTSELQSQSNLV